MPHSSLVRWSGLALLGAGITNALFWLLVLIVVGVIWGIGAGCWDICFGPAQTRGDRVVETRFAPRSSSKVCIAIAGTLRSPN